MQWLDSGPIKIVKNNFHFHFVSTHAYTFALQFLLLVFTGTFQSHKFVYHLVLFSCLLLLSMLSSFNFRWQFVIDYDCFSFFDIKKRNQGDLKDFVCKRKCSEHLSGTDGEIKANFAFHHILGNHSLLLFHDFAKIIPFIFPFIL